MSVDTARRVLEIESRAIADLIDRLDERFDEAVRRINECEGRVVVTGMGKSGIVGQKIAATLSSTGRASVFMHPAEAIHGDLGMLVAGDVLLAISNSGETEEIVRLLELVRRIGAGVIALTGVADSTLARESDVHIDVGVKQEACNLDLVPTSSTTAALAMGDALAVSCYELRGFSQQDFARFHPGGRLGRRLLRVGAIMHSDDSLPQVAAHADLKVAIEELDAKRLGVVCVTDDDGRLVGVLTDGDLRRRMLKQSRPLSGRADEAMISSPQTVGADALASEALHRMEDKKITSLPVIDEDRRLLGVIQIHDLWRTELF
ncbi:MAG: KpsF/GutQ family sugar-phosphate isomerase [Acidobacteriota bacterium]|nr:KpsF/GutQ family sugar-phosphate isomerase [Acidobacteriota bacterium]MDH3784477.1 KpsF/GutQ family sugar-phosphate isomerase [Acidobacteriota bacterium]